MLKSGVAPGILGLGADSFAKGLKYGFQGTINAKHLRENRCSPSDGAIPLALPRHHPWLKLKVEFV